jgi:hypothetical protein
MANQNSVVKFLPPSPSDDEPMIARPTSDFKLTLEEIAMLPDPEWVSEDDADAIVCMRREATGKARSIDEVLTSLGISREELGRSRRPARGK